MPETHASEQPRFIILDNSIVGLGGHFLDYALALLDGSELRGYSSTLVSHRSFARAVPARVRVERIYRFDNWPLASRAPIIRWLRLNMLPARQPSTMTVRSPARASSSFLEALRRRYDALDLVIRSSAFERGTTEAFERLRPRSQDLIFLPNPWIPELRGLAAAMRTYKGGRDLTTHLLLRREFRISESAAVRDAIHGLADTSPALRNLFYCDTPELAQLYQETSGIAFETLPIPHPTAELTEKTGNGPVQLCYVGDARCEKGFAALPDLVRRILELRPGDRPIRFVIQANAPSTGLEPKARAALAALRTMDPAIVTLIREPQERSAYEANILNSDIVLLPYDAEHYRYRSSGVLTEALSAGVPALVPEGTWLSSELQRFRQPGHSSILITDGLPGAPYSTAENGAFEKLCRMLAHLDAYQAVARDCAPHVRRRHNAESLVEALAIRARPAPLSAQSRLGDESHVR